MADFYEKETAAWRDHLCIAGADEAGRGPLAGPVVAAAVILPPDFMLPGVGDSKTLSAKKRERLFLEITKFAQYALGIVDPQTIDAINILNATRLAFKQAIEALPAAPNFVYCDYITKLDIALPYEAIVKGDATVYSIAAASIVAKVARDRIMQEYDVLYPQYGFAKHKGYGTKAHREALLSFGPCPIHRNTFLSKILP